MHVFRLFYPIILMVGLTLTHVGRMHLSDSIKYLQALDFLLYSFGLFFLWLERKRFYQAIIRWRKKDLFHIGVSLGVILLMVSICLLSIRPRFDLSIDLSEQGWNSLSEASHKVLQSLKKKKVRIKVTGFFIELKSKRKFEDLLGLYLGEIDAFDVSFVDPNLDVLAAKANAITGDHTIIMQVGNRSVRSEAFNEQIFTNMIVRLLRDDGGKVLFVRGHGENGYRDPSADGFLQAANTLREQNFVPGSISLAKASEDDFNEAKILMITSASENFPISEIRRLRTYLKNGGAIFLAIDAFRPVDSLNSLLRDFGLEYASNFVVLPKSHQKVGLYGQNAAFVEKVDPHHFMGLAGGFSHADRLVFSDTRSLRPVSNSLGWAAMFPYVSSDDNIGIDGVFSERDLEDVAQRDLNSGPFKLVATVRKNNLGEMKDRLVSKSSMLLVGSSHFMRNSNIDQGVNREFFIQAIEYLHKGGGLVSISSSEAENKAELRIDSAKSVVFLLLVCFAYPFGFLAFGLTICYLRRVQSERER